MASANRNGEVDRVDSNFDRPVERGDRVRIQHNSRVDDGLIGARGRVLMLVRLSETCYGTVGAVVRFDGSPVHHSLLPIEALETVD